MNSTTQPSEGAVRSLAIALLLPFTGFSHVETITCRGESMLPVMAKECRQRMDTSPEAFNRIQLGSVVVFRDPSSPTGCISHAVFKQMGPGVWWTHGVNKRTNRFADKVYVTRANFVGLLLDVSAPAKAR